MNWYWYRYWRIKKDHTPKKACSSFDTINSFQMFRCKLGIEWVMKSEDRLCFIVSKNKVIARLMDDYSLSVSYDAGSYIILVEKMTPNYGGS